MSTTTDDFPLVTTRWSSPDFEQRLPVENPATAQQFTVIQGASPETVDGAIRAAHSAFQTDWRWRPPRERGMLLQQASATIRAHAEELAALESREVGKPVSQARFDVDTCAATFAYFGGAADKLPGEFHDQGPISAAVMFEPYGVVGGIIPFNWPPVHTASKVAPALAMGNTVVLKPPEQAPLRIIRIVELLSEVLPPDVLHVVPGGPEVGTALTSHPLVRRVSFTGSSATGARVLSPDPPVHFVVSGWVSDAGAA